MLLDKNHAYLTESELDALPRFDVHRRIPSITGKASEWIVDLHGEEVLFEWLGDRTFIYRRLIIVDKKIPFCIHHYLASIGADPIGSFANATFF